MAASGSRDRKWTRRFIAGAFWLGAAAPAFLFGLDDLRLAYGMTGTPGTVTQVVCGRTGVDAELECFGRFTPAGGDPAESTEVIVPSPGRDGETFPARLRISDGGDWVVTPTDLKGRLAALPLPAMGALFIVPLPWVVFYTVTGRSMGRRQPIVMGAIAALLAGAFVIGLAVDNF